MKRRDPRNGFVLVTVLWTIALLSALAMGVSTTFRGYAGIIAIDHDRTRANALLTAGLEISAGIIGNLGDQPLTERETIVALRTGSVRVRLSDEGGRIDVNKAPVEVLSALLRSIGASDDANAIARSIEAWRARDGADQSMTEARPSSDPTPNDAAAPQGIAGGKRANSFRSFTDIRQLAQVPGMAPNYLTAIIPLTTVFGDDKVNGMTASADVIAALPGISPAQVEALLEARRHPPIADAQFQQILGQAQVYLKLKARPVALVELTAQLLDGYTIAVRAVIVLVPHDKQPYRVLAWTPVPLSERRGGVTSNRL